MQLQKDLEAIKAAGVNVVGLSRDSVEILNKFGTKNQIQYPLLSDPESKVIRKLSLVNEQGAEGTRKFEIAHPCTVVIGQDSKVAGVVPSTVREPHDVEKLMTAVGSIPQTDVESEAPPALNFTVDNIDGDSVELSKYKGKVVVMVNVASKCGMTPQYAPLQKLYDERKEDGLVILGFPCNQFGGQEPGTESEIMSFCEKNYGVEFDMFSKIDVNGKDASPLFKYLTAQDTKPTGAGKVRWNFEKFVIDRNGELAGRFGTRVRPDSDEFKDFVSKLLETK